MDTVGSVSGAGRLEAAALFAALSIVAVVAVELSSALELDDIVCIAISPD